ncbi:MAG: hypothetical protein CW341_01815 [Bacteroidetes bacterium]|nr:hypothetical protein [Bacteroidota bacterium]
MMKITHGNEVGKGRGKIKKTDRSQRENILVVVAESPSNTHFCLGRYGRGGWMYSHRFLLVVCIASADRCRKKHY